MHVSGLIAHMIPIKNKKNEFPYANIMFILICITMQSFLNGLNHGI